MEHEPSRFICQARCTTEVSDTASLAGHTPPEMATRAPHERLLEAREKAGLTQTELANKAGTSYQQVYKLEHGLRRLTEKWAKRLAPHLGVAPTEICETVSRLVHTAPLVGYVGAGSMIFADPVAGMWGTIEHVEAPPYDTGEVRAVMVRGRELEPRYSDGDLLYFSKEPSPLSECIGQECVVQVDGRRAWLAVIDREDAPGTYAISGAGKVCGGARIEWACPVLWVRRAKRKGAT